jgi:hypothetical protein
MLASQIEEPWLCIGDFNEIASPSEKKGGAPICIHSCQHFQRILMECGLDDIGSVGPPFTWRGPQSQGYDRVFKRLDRAVANQEWRILFEEACGQVLPRKKSDHHPILVTCKGLDIHRGGPQPFRFLAAWLAIACRIQTVL